VREEGGGWRMEENMDNMFLGLEAQELIFTSYKLKGRYDC